MRSPQQWLWLFANRGHFPLVSILMAEDTAQQTHVLTSSNFPSTLFLSKFKCDVPSCSPRMFLTHSKSVSTRDPARLFFVSSWFFTLLIQDTLWCQVPLNSWYSPYLEIIWFCSCVWLLSWETQQKPTLNVITQLCSGSSTHLWYSPSTHCGLWGFMCVCVFVRCKERVIFSRCKSLSFFFFCL